jgi:hypothetical protein
MADETQTRSDEESLHRGRIQAQGGGTEKSEAWAQGTAPTEQEMLARCDLLEAQLTTRERRERAQPMRELRRFIQNAATSGGISAPVSKSFLKRGGRGVRLDLEVITGRACVAEPEPESISEERA